jgi:hypothetical protein
MTAKDNARTLWLEGARAERCRLLADGRSTNVASALEGTALGGSHRGCVCLNEDHARRSMRIPGLRAGRIAIGVLL